MNMPTVTEEHVAELADLFRLLGDTTRMRIVLRCVKEPVSVSDIAASLDISQSLVSHHLRLLKSARVVTADRQGKQVFYVASDHHILRMLSNMLEHIEEDSQ
ncbi:ArsR/SmtB family transcription factor [Aeromonas caviae]|uniref:ArsR/SmtB family transcription factor n=1 Tax=Aeromonas TaxID=642 RepID=UPI00191D5E8A|nr:metalloregulator ArsR/SmtB family transcription factor [Aeromonas caviae]MBL0650379.1 winged helix-turn-helix transcriptional regulator [Aeromonas caviae]